MGLDTSHECWHGSYGRFNAFREALAVAAKLPPLRSMAGFEARDQAEAGLPWDPYRDDPLVILLDHSDCDGEITAEEATPLARRLLAMAEFSYDLAEEHRENARRFARGLFDAAARGEPVEFH